MSNQLLPCPFCGSAGKIEDHRTIWAVRCASCDACMLGERAPEPEDDNQPEGYWERFEKTAIDAWNRRSTQPAAGEPVATWVALTAAGQLRKGDKIRFRFGQETLTETVDLVLDAGTEREEIVYNRKRNFYFITSKALAGTSSAKEVEVLRTVSAPPAAAHGDEAVRKDAERYRWLRSNCEDGDLCIARSDGFSLRSVSGDDPDRYIDARRSQGDGEVQ